MIVDLTPPQPGRSPDTAEALLHTATLVGAAALAVGALLGFIFLIRDKNKKDSPVLVKVGSALSIVAAGALLGIGLSQQGMPTAEWDKKESAAVQRSVAETLAEQWNLEIEAKDQLSLFDSTNQPEASFIAKPIGDNNKPLPCKVVNFLASEKEAQRDARAGKPGKLRLTVTCMFIGEPKTGHTKKSVSSVGGPN